MTEAGEPSAPATGDIVIDAALADLDAVDPRDLDALITAADQVHDTLRTRLADLTG